MILERILRVHGSGTLFRFLERSKLGESRKGDDFLATITIRVTIKPRRLREIV